VGHEERAAGALRVELVSGERGALQTGFCPKCGALNGADFDRCIRCGAALSTRAASVDAARSHLDGQSMLGTKLIIGGTLAIYALQMAAGFAQRPQLRAAGSAGEAIEHALLVLRFGAILVNVNAVAAEPWRLLSGVFVHYDVLHILMNMLGLANLGRIAEPAIGTARFVIAYLVTGVVGFACTILYAALYDGNYGTTAGASGAVLGVMGVVLGWLIRRRDPRWKGFAMQALLYGVVFGFVVNASKVGLLVNNSAHIGGLLCGTILGALFAGSRPRSDLWVNLLAALGVIAAVASTFLPHWSPLAERRRLSSQAPAALAPVASKDAAAPAGARPWSTPPG
jgi:rhomboid protease GluP